MSLLPTTLLERLRGFHATGIDPDDREVTGSSSASCRFCANRLQASFVDLGMSPLCESFLSREQLNEAETFYPLHVFVCERCFLVQLQEYVRPSDIFTEYAYFSSYSESWLEHARQYAEQMIQRFGLGPQSSVVELASNDGYLLRNFVAHGIPALGGAGRRRRRATRSSDAVAFLAWRSRTGWWRRAFVLTYWSATTLAQVPDLTSHRRHAGPPQARRRHHGRVPHLLRLIRENSSTMLPRHF
jgi:hypothetical protein